MGVRPNIRTLRVQYLNMDLLKEHKKEQLRQIEVAA